MSELNLPCSTETFLQTYGKRLSKQELKEVPKITKIYYYKELFNLESVLFDTKLRCRGYNEWYLNISRHQHINYRFELVDFLGEGSFGRVFSAFDHKEKSQVAIKATNIKLKLEETLREYRIMKYLKKRGAKGYVVNVKHHFIFREIYFLVLEKHPGTLLNTIRTSYSRWSALREQMCDNDITNTYSRSLFLSLLCIKKLGILHADIKPGNLLLTKNGKSALKLADFGLSLFYTEFEKRTIRQTLCYRAPEVILGGKPSAAIDMWSAACVLINMYTGRQLFNGGNNEELISSMMELMGMPPQKFLKTCDSNLVSRHICPEGFPIYCHKKFDTIGGIKLEAKQSPIPKKCRVPPGKRTFAQKIGKNDPDLLDFVQKCFIWRPEKRMTVEEALLHPYLQPRHIKTSLITSCDVEMTSNKSSSQSGLSPKIGNKESSNDKSDN